MANLLLVLIISTILIGITRADEQEKPSTGDTNEPDFPRLFDIVHYGQPLLHLVAEMVSTDGGYQSFEELLDINKGLSAFVKDDGLTREINFIDTPAGMSHTYRPYKCDSVPIKELKIEKNYGFGTATVPFKDDGAGQSIQTVYGIAGLWLNAEAAKKSYATVDLIYSASKDVHRPAHRWTFQNPSKEIAYHFFFIKSTEDSRTTYSLEMIQFESTTTNEVTKTINILAFERLINNDDYNYLMTLPVGYGCRNGPKSEESMESFESRVKILFSLALNSATHRFEIEATATNWPDEKANKDKMSQRRSETVNIVSGRADLGTNAHQGEFQLIRERTSERDITTVINYLYNVKYVVDSRRGTCEIHHLAQRTDVREILSIEFANGLSLRMEPKTIEEVFVTIDKFNFIKAVPSSSDGGKTIYYERSTDQLFPDKEARIVRTYISKGSNGKIQLDSVTVWLLSPDKRSIEAAFYLNLIDVEQYGSFEELAKLMDVSEECYLDNEAMKAGKDYAWLDFHYALSSRHSELIASRADELKGEIYDHMITQGNINFFRIPRMELTFDDTGLTVRILLIDLPPLQLIYDTYKNMEFKYEAKKNELEEIAVDIAHCADLCRLHRCKAMSFCESEHICRMSREELDKDGSIPMVSKRECTTFLQPSISVNSVDELMKLSLHNLLSTLRHQDYGAVELPKLPDELALPMSETGLSVAEHRDAVATYMAELTKSLEDQGRLALLALTFIVDGSLIVLMPNKLEVEQDPLLELGSLAGDSMGLTGDDDSLDASAAFREGVPMRRFNVNRMMIDQPRTSRLFSDLSYDECALACVDANCNSFSFCTHRQECFITGEHELGAKTIEGYTEADEDCFISQRDYLSKFNKFPNVFRPAVYERTGVGLNPSECAHTCATSTDFKCQAFDFCSPPPQADERKDESSSEAAKANVCFYLVDRRIYTGASDAASLAKGNKAASKETGCDHYSRSYLADFLRVEYMQIKADVTKDMTVTTITGKSVDQCAEICASETVDCSAFQFHFDPVNKNRRQNCMLITSVVDSPNSSDNLAVVDESDGGKVVKVDGIFEANPDSHVFILRKDSWEAKGRRLALIGESKKEFEEEEREKQSAISHGQMTLAGGFVLFLCVTILSTAIGFGVCVAKDRSHFVRQKIERLQILVGARR